MQTIQKMIETILNDDSPIALAMIVHVEGSAYRKEGSWMLFQEDGTRVGVISGGCLEDDLHERARKLFGTSQAEVVAYDLSAEDDIGWGRGAGCNGVVSVLIRDIDKKYRQFLSDIHNQLLAKEPVVLLQSMQDFNHYRYVTGHRRQFEGIPFNLTDVTPFQDKAGTEMIEGDAFYCQVIWSQPALYIIGAGADARPLALFASQAGYAVHLLDWRESLCNAIHFPTADSLQIGKVERLLTNIPFSSLDAVVIMTHDFQLDVQLLQQLSGVQLLYLGILGSKKRTVRLLGGEIPTWIHSPVGLTIGADGPEEIAISIVAELIAVRRRKRV